MDYEGVLLDKILSLQEGLVSIATGGSSFEHEVYKAIRTDLLNRQELAALVPLFLRRCYDTYQFWHFIKGEFPTYRERRTFIWNELRPLIDHLEAPAFPSGPSSVSEVVRDFEPTHLLGVWQKALNRSKNDPEGAITAAKTYLESICKHILDDLRVPYDSGIELPKLWSLTASHLNLSPSQHQEEIFRSILGSLQNVVDKLGAIRNRLGDAHGHGRRPVKPKCRHAELVIDSAGTMAKFLISTYQERRTAQVKMIKQMAIVNLPQSVILPTETVEVVPHSL